MLTSLYFDCCEIRETGQWNSLRKKNVKERNREMSSSFDEGPKVRGSKEEYFIQTTHVLVFLGLTWDIPS